MNLVIATTTYFAPYDHVPNAEYRRPLWKMFVDSFHKSNLAGHDISVLVCDDNSPTVPLYWFDVPSVRIDRDEHLGAGGNQMDCLDRAATMAEYCLAVDSDAYFAPDWLTWLTDAVERYPNAAGWVLFNSQWHVNYAEPAPEPGYRWKKNCQVHGLCYRTADRGIIGDPNEWIENFIPKLAEKGNFLCPEVSKIQHTGMYGVNNKPGAVQDFDQNFEFNHLCGLPQKGEPQCKTT